MKLSFYLFILAVLYAVSAENLESTDIKCKAKQLVKCQAEYSKCVMKNILNSTTCLDDFKACKERKCQSDNNLNYFEPTKDNVKILGRAKYQDGYLWVGVTDAGIEYTFNGKTTVIDVTADAAAYSEETPAYIGIYADGEVYQKTLIKEKNTEFTVNFDKKGKHTVTFIKLSESERGSIRINEIRADVNKIKPTAQKKRKIEFVGDSITCAYGVDGTETDHYSTDTQDGTKSYAYLTAKKFDADYSIYAHSGFAILSCVSFDGERTPMSTIPPIYDKLGLTFGPNEFDDGTYELQTTPWDLNEYVPDLIVINLGTNDASYFDTIDESKVPSEKLAFIQNYEDFLAQLRGYYPKAEILCTYGTMGQEVYPEIEQAVNNYIEKTNDTHVNIYKFNVQNIDKNGLGADGHPNVQSQIEAAHELIDVIEKTYKWKPNPKVNIDL